MDNLLGRLTGQDLLSVKVDDVVGFTYTNNDEVTTRMVRVEVVGANGFEGIDLTKVDEDNGDTGYRHFLNEKVSNFEYIVFGEIGTVLTVTEMENATGLSFVDTGNGEWNRKLDALTEVYLLKHEDVGIVAAMPEQHKLYPFIAEDVFLVTYSVRQVQENISYPINKFFDILEELSKVKA